MLKNRVAPIICLFLILILTVLVYSPGLKGGFIFDDLPNLGQMNQYGDMHDWDNIKKFVNSGTAGPTGRPVSLLTFVPQADDWLAGNAFPFKVVNLIIHLLCGMLLYWVTQLLLRAYGEVNQKKIVWVALLTAGFWLLHPLMLSTTLYVIQRMAQLPLLFSLLAIIGYFKGRALLAVYPLKAYLIMTLSIGLGTILTTFSKENGALLPLLILVIEFCNPNKNHKPMWQWRAVCLWLPSLAIVALLARTIDFSSDPWPNRNFNQIERLFTEGRIVVDYLAQLVIPRIEGYGLFQDGFLVSKGWLSPPTTLFSILFLLALLISSLLVRKKYPLITLAILFFFAAHLMESTFIGLELYFEHRNYVAAIFLFLPLAIGLYALSEMIKPSVVIFISVLLLAFVAAMTWQRAILWSDTTRLQLFWAQNSPNSARGRDFIARKLIDNQQYGEAIHFLENAIQQHPDSGVLSLGLLSLKVSKGVVTHQDFLQTAQSITLQRVEYQNTQILRGIVFFVLDDPLLAKQYSNDLIHILDALMKNRSYSNNADVMSIITFLKASILLAQDKPLDAYQHFSQALILSGEPATGFNMVVALANAGYRELALSFLNEIETMYQKKLEKDLKQPNEFYEQNIQILRRDLQKDPEQKIAP
jgi:tetratricopeptide (TPR) repeat protein